MQCIFTIHIAIQLLQMGGVHMAFQIKSDRKETENKTIRFPVQLIDKINDVIKKNDVTFSGFVIQACEYAIDNIEKKN